VRNRPLDTGATASVLTGQDIPTRSRESNGGQHDLRLVPAACCAWATALVGVLWGWWAAALVAVVSGVSGAVGIWRERRPAATRSHRLGMWAALLLCAATVATATVLRINIAGQDQLRDHAARHAEVLLRVTVAERATPLRSPGYAGQRSGTSAVLVPATVESAAVAGQAVSSNAAVTIIADPAQWGRLLPGQQLTLRGTLAPSDTSELTAAVVYARGPPRGVRQGPPWQRAAASLRAGLHAACRGLDEGPAGLLPGLVVGDTSELPAHISEEFTAAGLSHLTAVSGTHLNIVCGAVLLLLRTGRAGPRVTAATAGVVLVGFVVLVGQQPSVLRAGVMTSIGLLALALGRRRATVPALALAVIGVVGYEPAMAASFGFALSVAATAGIVLLAPRWSAALTRRRVPRTIAVAVTVPAAASIVTVPIIAGMAGRVSLVAIPANLLATPVVAPVLLVGVVVMLLASISPAAAAALAGLVEFGLHWLIGVAHHAVRLPGSVVSWPAGWWGGLLALLAVVVLLLLVRVRTGRILTASAVVGIVLVLIPTRVIAPPWPPAEWSFVACDVGQGDAAVLRTGVGDSAILVDTGPSPGRITDCLDRLGVGRVPLVVLTHLHADHIGGLAGVLREYPVEAVAVGPGRTPEWAREQVVEQAAAAAVPVRALHQGQRLGWPELRLTVLAPDEPTSVAPGAGDSGTAVNNTSVVLRATTPAGRILLTGDVELAAQAALLAGGWDLTADVVKVPHHGSDVFLPRLFRAVSARVAVISVGAHNDYGHPSRRMLRTLHREGSAVARTDLAGSVAVVADVDGLVVVRQRTPE